MKHRELMEAHLAELDEIHGSAEIRTAYRCTLAIIEAIEGQREKMPATLTSSGDPVIPLELMSILHRGPTQYANEDIQALSKAARLLSSEVFEFRAKHWNAIPSNRSGWAKVNEAMVEMDRCLKPFQGTT